MKTILTILICFIAPIVAYVIYALIKTIRRYYTDATFRSRMDKRKSAIMRSKKVNQTKSKSIFPYCSDAMRIALGKH